ncbi:MAG: oxygenase MpaB family protein [Acidimicrobiales bacterium]
MTPAPETLEAIRTQFGQGIRRVLAGTAEPPERALTFDEDPGLFGPDSTTFLVHTDASMVIGGLRALLLQTMHPLAMAGVADHSDYRNDPLGRLHRTGGFVGTTTFGTTDEAERAIRVVRKVHERVTGTAPDGRPYAATDPHLLLFVHCTEVDSFLRARQRYGATALSSGDGDRYVEEMAVVAEKLGVRRAPRSRDELRAVLDGYRSEHHIGSQARDTVRFLAWPPLPLATRPAYALVFAAAVSMLPRDARWKLRLPIAPLAEPFAIRPAATVLMRTLGWALAEPAPA